MRHRMLFWPILAGVTYLGVSLVVLATEYFSEMSKISRGFYTDTFSPFMWTHIVSFPVSAFHSDWHGYPLFFDGSTFRRSVRAAVSPAVLNIVIEAVLLASVVLLVVAWTQRRKRSGPSA